jgi:uncharacterized membrane protein YccC
VSWNLRFADPIILPDGTELAALRDAYDQLNKFPKSEQDTEEWKAATQYLIEAAEHGGAVAFARIGVQRAMKRQADRAPTSELVDLTLREVQHLQHEHIEPKPRNSEPTIEVLELLENVLEAPSASPQPSALAVPSFSMANADDRNRIASETLQSAITNAVKKAEPACEAFVGVIVERTTPKSRFDANWALRGVKFGRADREKANKAVTTIVERMRRDFRLSDD